MSTCTKYKVYKALEYAGAWCVEPADWTEDDIPVTRFYGHCAHSRAVEYVYWKQHFEREPLHV